MIKRFVGTLIPSSRQNRKRDAVSGKRSPSSITLVPPEELEDRILLSATSSYEATLQVSYQDEGVDTTLTTSVEQAPTPITFVGESDGYFTDYYSKDANENVYSFSPLSNGWEERVSGGNSFSAEVIWHSNDFSLPESAPLSLAQSLYFSSGAGLSFSENYPSHIEGHSGHTAGEPTPHAWFPYRYVTAGEYQSEWSANLTVAIPGTDAKPEMWVRADTWVSEEADVDWGYLEFLSNGGTVLITGQHNYSGSVGLQIGGYSNTADGPGYYKREDFIPVKVGDPITATISQEFSLTGPPEKLRAGTYGTYGVGATVDYQIFTFDPEVATATFTKDGQYLEVLFSSDISPEYFDSCFYWFDLGADRFNDTSGFAPEFASPSGNRTVALSPETFKNYELEELGKLEDTPFWNTKDFYRVSIPVSDFETPPTASSRLMFQLDCGEPTDFSQQFDVDGVVFELFEERYNNFFEIRPEFVIEDLEWTEEGGVEGSYSFLWFQSLADVYQSQANNLPVIDMFWSVDDKPDSLDYSAVTAPLTIPVSPKLFQNFEFTKSQIVDPIPDNIRHLIAIVDSPPVGKLDSIPPITVTLGGREYDWRPNNPFVDTPPPLIGNVYETFEANNVESLPVGDIYDGFAFLTEDDPNTTTIEPVELHYFYEIRDNDLPYRSDVKFYWSDSDTIDANTRLKKAANERPVLKEVGQYWRPREFYPAINVEDEFSERPEWAEYILLVYDEANNIREYDETNNVFAIPLSLDYELESSDWTWNAAKGGIDGSYVVDTDTIAPSVTLEFYWSPTAHYDENTAIVAAQALSTKTTEGRHDVRVEGKDFNIPRAGDEYLIVIVDNEDKVAEADEINNVAQVLFVPTAPSVRFYVEPDPAERKELYEGFVEYVSTNPVPLDGYTVHWADPAPHDKDRTEAERADFDPTVRIVSNAEGEKSVGVLNPHEARTVSLGFFERTWDWIEPRSPLEKIWKSTLQNSLAGFADLITQLLDGAYSTSKISEFTTAVSKVVSGVELARLGVFAAIADTGQHILQLETNNKGWPVPLSTTHLVNLKVSDEQGEALVAYAASSTAGAFLVASGIRSFFTLPGAYQISGSQLLGGVSFLAMAEVFYKLAADPPDSNYTERVTIEASNGFGEVLESFTSGTATESFVKLIADHNSLKTAEAAARDKADGAAKAGDNAWRVIQLIDASRFADRAFEVELQMLALAERLGIDAPEPVDWSEITPAIEQDGLPELFEQSMKAVGFSQAQIDSLAGTFSELEGEQPILADVNLPDMMRFGYASTALTAMEHLRQAVELRIASGIGGITEISAERLQELADSRTSIENLVEGGASWSTIYPLLEEFREEIRQLIEQTNDFEAVADHLDFAYGAILVLGYETPPQVASIVVNDGDSQRSVVRSITVEFDREVMLAGEAFEVGRADGAIVGVHAASSSVNGRTQVLLTFFGENTDASGSLIDGEYYFKINSAYVQDETGAALDGDANLSSGGDFIYEFHRLAGDSDGDRDVDMFDLSAFRAAYLSTIADELFNNAFDFDEDGDVDTLDYLIFRRNYNKVLGQ